MSEKPYDFKGVFVPRVVWLDGRLTSVDKVILMEVHYLDNEDGCYASNARFAELCGCSESKVAHAVSKLKELGYVEQVSFNGRTRVLRSLVDERVVEDASRRRAGQDYTNVQGRLAHPCKADLHERARQTCSSVQGHILDNKERLKDKNKYNVENGDHDQSGTDVATAVIEYLNERAGTNYRPGAKGNRKNVNGRLSEGYTLDDFRTVIDRKCRAWLGDPRMRQYLRPATLFSPEHFDAYLNEPDPSGASSGTDYGRWENERDGIPGI